jgi:hypothetical protein
MPLGGGAAITLASGLAEPQAISVNTNTAYWTLYGGGIQGIPLGGGAVTSLSTGCYSQENVNFVVDEANAYCSQPGNGAGSVISTPLSGGDGGITVLAAAANSPIALAANATTVFWGNAWAGLQSVPLAGGALVTSIPEPDGLGTIVAIDPTYLYWAGSGGSVIFRAPLAGGTEQTLATFSIYSGLSDIAVDPTSVYWTETAAGAVMKAPLDAGTAVTLAAGQTSPFAIAVDSNGVYWTNSAEATDGGVMGRVMKMALDGGVVTTLASGQSQTQGVVLDDASVYWIEQSTVDGGAYGSVMKLTPK